MPAGKKDDPLTRASARLRASMAAFEDEEDEADEESSPVVESCSTAKRVAHLKKILTCTSRAHHAKPWGILFRRYDRDHSGDTNFEEFLEVMRDGAHITAEELSDEDLQVLFDSMDKSYDGTMNYRKDFLPWMQTNHAQVAREEDMAAEDMLGHSPIDATAAPAKINEKRVNRTRKKLTDLARLHAAKPWPTLFRAYDRDDSGDISFDEFLLVMREGAHISEVELSDEDLHILFYSADKDHGGAIDWKKEFLPFLNANSQKAPKSKQLAEDLCIQLQSKLRSATVGISLPKFFKRFDKDRTGSLNVAQMRHLIRAELHIPLTMMNDKDIEMLVKALDDDGSGSLSIEELVEFIEMGSATFGHHESEEEIKHVHEQRKRAADEKRERRRQLMREWALKQEWHCPRCNFLNNDPAECDLCGCERPEPAKKAAPSFSQSQALSARLAKKKRRNPEAWKERLEEAAATSTGLLPGNKYTKQLAIRCRLKAVRERVDPDHMLAITSTSHEHPPVHTYSHLFVEDVDGNDTQTVDNVDSPQLRSSQRSLSTPGARSSRYADDAESDPLQSTQSLSPRRKKSETKKEKRHLTPAERQQKIAEELIASSEKITQRGCERLFAGQHEAAVGEFGKAIRANPKNAAAWSYRAVAAIGVGNYTAAIHDCDHAVELDFLSAPAYCTRGVAPAQSQDF
mmetsp:Transcript_40622/g.74148  ORF Transcript_40622/g.74148 Transcript_40622/m.74148 type:complete len:685 (-) Transcript_40622:11-2065(-)